MNANESIILAASKRRILLSLVILPVDILRFVAIDEKNDAAEQDISKFLNINPCDLPKNETGQANYDHAKGWFALRTCSLDFFREQLTPKYIGNVDYWAGVIDAYRCGVKLGEKIYLDHANKCLTYYAERIKAQIEVIPNTESVSANSIREGLLQSSVIHANSKDPLQSEIDFLGESNNAVFGLGEYVIASKNENGYFNSYLCGWVENKMAATPFESKDDVYLHSGDSTTELFATAPSVINNVLAFPSSKLTNKSKP